MRRATLWIVSLLAEAQCSNGLLKKESHWKPEVPCHLLASKDRTLKLFSFIANYGAIIRGGKHNIVNKLSQNWLLVYWKYTNKTINDHFTKHKHL